MSEPSAASVTVVVPVYTLSEANVRQHWAKRHRRAKSQRQTCWLAVRNRLPSCFALGGQCVVTLTRIAPRVLDDDNLRGALKACRDGVADALCIDDRDDRVRWEYAQRSGDAGEYAVEVTITTGGCHGD